jgi:hypothetical protein
LVSIVKNIHLVIEVSLPKVANVGDSIIGVQQPGTAQQDVQAIGFIVNALADTTSMVRGAISASSPTNLSLNARSFVDQSEDHAATELLKVIENRPNQQIVRSTDKLTKHEFLQLSIPGGSWSLKRHYFETFPMGIRVGGRAEPISY